MIEEKKKRKKMYILVRDCIPLGHAINCNAHASLQCYLKFKDDPDMIDWLATSFAKVTCSVTDEEFKRAISCADRHIITTESDYKGGEMIAVSFCPRDEWPAMFKTFPLYK